MSAYLVQGKGWRYDSHFMGTRINGAWFETKLDALVEEGVRKELMKKQSPMPATGIDTDFLTLCNRRLDHLKTYKTARYYEENVVFLKRMIRPWGNKPCSQITREMVKKYFEGRPKAPVGKRKRMPSKGPEDRHAVANYELRMLRALFNFGLDEKLISNNPAVKIPFLPRLTKRRRYVPPAEDILKLLKASAEPEKKKHRKKADKRKSMKGRTEGQGSEDSLNDFCYLVVMIFTLGRMGEINRLEWPDVHFDPAFLTLYTRKKKGGNLTPRDIHMLGLACAALRYLFEKRDPSVSWVFHHRYWSRKEKRFVVGPYKDRKKLMKTLCRKAQIRYFRYHSLRHFGASLMAHLGVALTEIQKILGHESLSTTEEYIQSLVGADRRAMETFAQTLTELLHTIPTQQIKQGASPEANPLFLLVGRTGIEPATR
jgi:integrase